MRMLGADHHRGGPITTALLLTIVLIAEAMLSRVPSAFLATFAWRGSARVATGGGMGRFFGKEAISAERAWVCLYPASEARPIQKRFSKRVRRSGGLPAIRAQASW